MTARNAVSALVFLGVFLWTMSILITRLRQLEFPLRTNTEHYDL